MYLNKPIICISNSSNYQVTGGNAPRQIVCPQSYPRAIALAGGVPILTCEFAEGELAVLCDGLLLSGGEDIEPELFGETLLNNSVCLDPQRTQYELNLIRAFLAAHKPILAICRGFQLLNVVLGGTLYQDLLEQKGLVHNHPDIRHPVFTREGSLLRRLYGREFKVNSTHHQAVKQLASGLMGTAWSIEGILEGYEHEALPIIGVQFHPERLTNLMWDDRTPDFGSLFGAFIQRVKDQ